jgi:serine/threonine-protein kinase
MANAGVPVDQSLVGAILSRRYRLTQELGRGGMGAVYAAQPVEGGPPVAVKILHAAFLDDDQVRTRFIEEGHTGIRLVHRNILRMHEVLTAEDGSPYLVMDLLEGVPLSAYTKNGGRIAPVHAVPILQGILSGLAVAHQQGVVHRDLKPGNVFLARDDAGLFVVKILDFGIAKVMDVAGGMGNRTRTGMLLGTPAYMSPEQITNAKEVDARADLWSAGILFYEMLTGRTAFPAPTEYARLSAVLQNEPEPIERVDPSLAPVAPFVVQSIQKNRDLRFQTAQDMARALQLVAAGEAGTQSRVSFLPLSRLPDRPWMNSPTPAPAVVVGAAGGSPATTPAPGAGGGGGTGPIVVVSPTPAPAILSSGVPTTKDETTRIDVGTPAPNAIANVLAMSPGGTLASLTPANAPTPEPQIRVVMAPKPGEALGGTLPSERSRVPRRGLAVRWVAVMVALAFAVGIGLGVLVGRMH